MPNYGSEKEAYEQIRGWVMKLGDNIGNSVYNKDTPFVSDFVGEAFHSSDREESGDSSNLASVSGAFVNGFVGTGALGTVDGIGGMIADPYGAAEGIVSMLANREEAYVMIKEAAMKAVDENLINGGWEDRSRVAGAVVFEVFSAIYSAGALSAAKAGDKAGDAGKASKLLNRVSDAGGGIKRGISRGAKKTLGGKVAKEAAEEAAEKADDILGDLARKMSGPGGDNLDDYSMVKGWLEEQGKSLEIMDEGGVNIHKVEGAVDDVLEGGEVLKRGSGVIESGSKTNLLDELASSGVKYNPDDVITVIKNPDGKLMWLEEGNSKAGLTHILERHADDFAAQGVSDIPNLLENVLSTNPIRTGSNAKGLFADYTFNGNSYRVAYGTNGFVVSFYPID